MRPTTVLSSLASVLLLALSFAAPARAQSEARPASFDAPSAAVSEVERIALPSFDNDALLARDEAQSERQRTAGTPTAQRFAEPVAMALDARTRGTWESLADGRQVWRLRVTSPGAYSLNVGFSQFRLPEGATLWLYPTGEAPLFRAFTAADNEQHGELWTPVVPSDDLTIEVNLPRSKTGQAPDFDLEIGQIAHAYRPFGLTAEQRQQRDRQNGRVASGSCNVDVVCPEGDDYRNIIRSSGAYTRGGTDICSGAAINNALEDGRPLFLTANHCGNSTGNASSIVIYWNYQNSTCRPVGSPASGGPGDGPLSQFNSGTRLLGSAANSDWALLEMDDPFDASHNVYLSGWDRRDIAPASVVAIHHPNVEEKRISFEDDPTTITSYLSDTVDPNAAYIRVDDWDLGTTEGGSSGSPIYNADQQIVGQLHGGFAACGNDDPDWYGRMFRSMAGGLDDFLDPTGSGVETLGGREAGQGVAAAFTASTTQASAGETVRLSLTVDNFTDGDADGATFATTLPTGLVYAGNADTSVGTVSEVGGTVTWDFGIAGGGASTLSFDVALTDGATGTLSILGTITQALLDAPLQVVTRIEVFQAADQTFTSTRSYALPDDGCPSLGGTTLDVANSFSWGELKVGVVIAHTYRGDLRVQLESPAGTSVNLLDRPGAGTFGTGAANLDALFSDSGTADLFGTSGDHNPGAPFYEFEGQPEQGGPGTTGVGTLASFNGEDPRGTWTLRACDGAGQDTGSLEQWALLFYGVGVDAEDEAPLPDAFSLSAAYPNPFTESATLALRVRDAQEVRAEVYDPLGRRVRVLHDGPVAANASQTLTLDAATLPSGLYVVRVVGETFAATETVLLVR
ncbi:MAG: proprotein convertase P-domain-containing protein [Bacteroidota bacterium]